MGHSTGSGINARDENRRFVERVQRSLEREGYVERQSLTQPQTPRYELALDLRADVPSIVRNLERGTRLNVINDYSDLTIERTGDDEYSVHLRSQDRQTDRYTSNDSYRTVNRGQASRIVRNELNERSTVRLGNETLYRRPRR